MDLSILLEKPYKELLNALFNFEIYYSYLKLRVVKESSKKSLYFMAYLWPLVNKSGQFQIMDLSLPLERPYKELLNALFNFNICCSCLKLSLLLLPSHYYVFTCRLYLQWDLDQICQVNHSLCHLLVEL